MEIVPIYDRSTLIRRAIDNVSQTLVEVVLAVVFIVLLFLWHVPSALIPLITLPVAVLVAFIPFQAMGMTANIMSLGGIAIAMGELVDAAIVVVEQTHKKLELAQRDGSTTDYHKVVLEAVREVAPASFFALLVIAVSFLPVLALESQEGRLFKPLAYTKTLTMIVAAALVITLDPALRVLFTRMRRFEFRPAWLCRVVNAVAVGRIRSEESHPISRFLTWVYEPVVSLVTALEVGGHRRGGGADGCHRPSLHCCSDRSSCRPSGRARSSTCRRRCRASRSARRRSCSR